MNSYKMDIFKNADPLEKKEDSQLIHNVVTMSRIYTGFMGTLLKIWCSGDGKRILIR